MGVLRMGLRSSESSRGRAGIPRGFSRPLSWPAPGGYSIEVLVSVRVSERARPEHKARAWPGPGSAIMPTERSAGFHPRGFCQRESSSQGESPYTLEFKCVAVRERATSGSGKCMQRVTLISNQAFERTLPRYALQRRSRHC